MESFAKTTLAFSIMPKPSKKVEQVPTQAPMPYLRIGKVVSAFKQLKKIVLSGCGFDFLAVCGDVMRPRNFRSDKVGVASRSRHIAADAFDYDQSNKNLIIVSEPHGLQQFFRTWLRCSLQDGSLGIKTKLKDIRGSEVTGYYFDFTSAAERLGWQRIPAWKGWAIKGVNYNKCEFWHYQLTEGLSFDEAINFLYNDLARVVSDVRKPPTERILGLNDRGSAVRNIQEKLSKILDKDKKPYLPREEIDGVFGKKTETAVKRLQEAYGLADDGMVGPNTRQLIERLT
jgi:hypothetical protein